MKKKHHGLVRMIIFCMAIGVVVAYGNHISGQITGSIQMERPAVNLKIEIPDSSTMAYIAYLTPHLEDLSNLQDNHGKVDLMLFGYDADTGNKNTDPTGTGKSGYHHSRGSGFPYKLSLCFSSKKTAFCIIDNRLYKEKALLPDKAKVLKIENDRVLIKKLNRQEWVYSL